MRYRLPILALLIVASGTLLGDDKPKENPEKFVISQAEKEVLDLTNQERLKEKLTPLKPHPLFASFVEASYRHRRAADKTAELVTEGS